MIRMPPTAYESGVRPPMPRWACFCRDGGAACPPCLKAGGEELGPGGPIEIAGCVDGYVLVHLPVSCQEAGWVFEGGAVGDTYLHRLPAEKDGGQHVLVAGAMAVGEQARREIGRLRRIRECRAEAP